MKAKNFIISLISLITFFLIILIVGSFISKNESTSNNVEEKNVSTHDFVFLNQKFELKDFLICRENDGSHKCVLFWLYKNQIITSSIPLSKVRFVLNNSLDYSFIEFHSNINNVNEKNISDYLTAMSNYILIYYKSDVFDVRDRFLGEK